MSSSTGAPDRPSPRGKSQPARRPPAPAAMRNSHHGFSSRQLAAWSLIQAPSGWWLASKDTFARHAALVTAPAWSFRSCTPSPASAAQAPARAAGTRSTSGPSPARRRPAAMTGLDVIAAGISLPASGLWHRLYSVAWCRGVPGRVAVTAQGRWRGRCGACRQTASRRVPSPGSGTRCSRSPCCSP